MKVWSKHIKEKLKEIEDFLLDEYKENKEQKKRDWRTYEQQLGRRIKGAIRNLEPLIDEATSTIKVHREKGRKPTLILKQKVMLLLLKELVAKSNRSMALMMDIFSILSGIDVSYKTVERLYSDPEVEMAIHNLHILILKKKGVHEIEGSGDGTGYSLTIRKHYASEAEKRKERIKESKTQDDGVKKGKKKKLFIYSFKVLDLDTRMYVSYGMSFISEKRAFYTALSMLKENNIKVKRMRLDRYYSHPSIVNSFPDSRVYVIPKINSTLRGPQKWKDCMISFVLDTRYYLEQYYRRNQSETEISVDKRWFGWKIDQRREDRINTAHSCDVVWHNLFRLY